jgi:cysteine desulfurase
MCAQENGIFGGRSFSSAMEEASMKTADGEEISIKMKGISLSGRPMYLDMQSTTPLDPRVLDAMLPYFTDMYGNPHSRTHMYGWESEDAIETARKQVTTLFATFCALDNLFSSILFH